MTTTATPATTTGTTAPATAGTTTATTPVRTRCRVCRGFLVREPARVVCRSCGRGVDLVDAHPADQRRQGRLDFALRARSAECRAESGDV